MRLIGRFDPPGPGAEAKIARFAWSGSAFEVRFTGPSAAMLLRTAALEPHLVMVDGKPVTIDEKTSGYSVEVDGHPPKVIEVSDGTLRYELASGLEASAPHVVRVTREAEAFAGVHELLGVELGAGGTFLPKRARARRIEVVGDSISCGYGVLGDKPDCPFTYATERVTAAYGERLARSLDADLTTVCWSGRGVLRNYDGSTTGTMPELFETTIPIPPATTPWTFTTPPPEAVIVNLGTNDFLGGRGQPLDVPAFEAAYVRFTKRLRDVYPASRILVTTSPMIGEAPLKDVARGALERVVARRTADGDSHVELVVLVSDAPASHWGCDGHPDPNMNARIAVQLGSRF